MNKKPIPEEYQGLFTFIVWFFSAGIALVPLSAINQFLSDLNRASIISNNLTFTATEATLSLILSIAQTAVALFFIYISHKLFKTKLEQFISNLLL